MARRALAISVLTLLTLSACQPTATVPPPTSEALATRPSASFVEVAPGIRLEVLEWNAEGEPLVLLAGASHSAHAWVDFAPHLTDRFRVIAITRRRVGASDAPPEPFGIDDLGRDILAVLDAFEIDRADFVGHSFGGAELSWLALNHPERARRMVYLDGSWDFSRVYYADGWWSPWPEIPITPADSASPQAMAAYFARTWGPLFPLEEIRAIHRFDAAGKLVALDPNVGWMFRDMIGPTLDTLDYSRFRTPILAVRAVPETVTDFFPGYASFDPENQRRADATLATWQRVVIAEGDRFVALVPDVEEVRIRHGHHEVIGLHAEQVLPAVRGFLLRN